jgi:hypothetical protein
MLFLRPDVRGRTTLLAMTPEAWVHLIEEMMDLKIQHYAESTMKVSADVARVLQDKRETDRRRLEQIRNELVRTLKA